MKFTSFVSLKEATPAQKGAAPPPPANQPKQQPQTGNPPPTGNQPPVDPKIAQAAQAFEQGITTLETNMLTLIQAKQLDPNIAKAFLALKALIPKK